MQYKQERRGSVGQIYPTDVRGVSTRRKHWSVQNEALKRTVRRRNVARYLSKGSERGKGGSDGYTVLFIVREKNPILRPVYSSTLLVPLKVAARVNFSDFRSVVSSKKRQKFADLRYINNFFAIIRFVFESKVDFFLRLLRLKRFSHSIL